MLSNLPPPPPPPLIFLPTYLHEHNHAQYESTRTKDYRSLIRIRIPKTTNDLHLNFHSLCNETMFGTENRKRNEVSLRRWPDRRDQCRTHTHTHTHPHRLRLIRDYIAGRQHSATQRTKQPTHTHTHTHTRDPSLPLHGTVELIIQTSMWWKKTTKDGRRPDFEPEWQCTAERARGQYSREDDSDEDHQETASTVIALTPPLDTIKAASGGRGVAHTLLQ